MHVSLIQLGFVLMDGFINNLNKNNLNTVSLILIQVYLLRTGLVKNYLLFEFRKN